MERQNFKEVKDIIVELKLFCRLELAFKKINARIEGGP